MIVVEEMRPVRSRSVRSNDLKPENKTLVVVTTMLQLSVIVVVWLLAIVPAGLLALAAMIGKAVAGLFSDSAKRPPMY